VHLFFFRVSIKEKETYGLVRFGRIDLEPGPIRQNEMALFQTAHPPDLLFGYVRSGINLDPVPISPSIRGLEWNPTSRGSD
jgi:hypothetical protein